jgi:hypothetical protein
MAAVAWPNMRRTTLTLAPALSTRDAEPIAAKPGKSFAAKEVLVEGADRAAGCSHMNFLWALANSVWIGTGSLRLKTTWRWVCVQRVLILLRVVLLGAVIAVGVACSAIGHADPSTTSTTSGPSAYYPNCKAACNAGVAPLHRGDPGYRPGLDRDSDGIACEWCP